MVSEDSKDQTLHINICNWQDRVLGDGMAVEYFLLYFN
jgi:hypothetical protein